MSKKLYIPLLAAGIVVLGISGAMAKPDKTQDPHAGRAVGKQAGGMKHESCPGMAPEKREAVMKIAKEYRRALGPLQDQLTVKRYELEALSRNPNTQPEMLSKISAEIGTLFTQIRNVKENRNTQLETELGFLPRHPERLAECPIGAATPPAAPENTVSAAQPESNPASHMTTPPLLPPAAPAQ